jgi:Cellulase (glycosyl hydrolase family 5)
VSSTRADPVSRPRREGGRRRVLRGPRWCAIVFLTLILVPASALVGSAKASPVVSTVGPSLASGAGSVNLSYGSPFPLSSDFWGATISARANLLPSEADLISSTPARVLVWPGGGAGDGYDPLNNTLHSALGGKSTPPLSEPQFIGLCEAVQCTAIFQVPGEINSSSTAAAIVVYTESILHFRPSYWEIGNEPTLWKNWGRPWLQWNATRPDPAPGPLVYAHLVQRYVNAIRAVDPTAQIIGLPGIGKGGPQYAQWVKDTVSVNGPNISAVAVHEYPANTANSTITDLTQFYATLHGVNSIPVRTAQIRTWIHETCSSCNIAVFLTEIGSTLDHRTYAGYGAGFPGMLDMAAQMTQGMTWNVSNIDLYAAVFGTVNSWFSLQGAERPTYGVYSSVLSRLGSVVYPVSISSPTTGVNLTTYAVGTLAPNSGNRADLLVVNTNLSTNDTFTPRLPAGPAASPTEAWTWVNNTTSAPTVSFYPGGVPSTYTLPAQSLVLFESYPQPTAPVRFDETGVPSGQRWFVDVNGTVSSSAGSNLTLFLPTGVYPTSAPTLLVTDRQRYEPFPPTSVLVTTTPTDYLVPFAHQWNISVVSDTLGGGQVVPAPGWANDSVPLSLTALPAPGFLFDHWFGWGPGSYNGSVNPTVVTPTGPLTERAIFVGGFPVVFHEVGLPNGTAWSVTVRGIVHNSTNATVLFQAANGSYGFDVGNVSGYRAQPPAGSVNVTGAPVQVPITFQRLTPPGKRYNVSFAETGLPLGTTWLVSVQNTTMFSTTENITFQEANGTRGYDVGTVPGYRAHPPAGAVNVSGGPVLVPIVFQKLTPPGQRYNVTFVESGLPSGLNWSVTVRNVTLATTATQLTFHEANGTSGFDVGNVSGYRAHPPAGSVNISGAPAQVSIAFQQLTPPGARYSVTFVEGGLPAGSAWSIIVRNQSITSAATSLSFQEANGSYGYRIGLVPGYRVVGTNTGFVVHGAPTSVTVSFERTLYLVIWNETGLWKGLTWNVVVDGARYNSTSSWVTAKLANGSYVSTIRGSEDWSARQGQVNFSVAGADVVVNVNFIRSEYPVIFYEDGLPSNLSWSVRFSDENLSPSIEASALEAGTVAPNGTYTFDVVAPQGYYPAPSHGVFTVHAGPAALTISFFPSHPEPIPSIWSLGPKAIVVATVIGVAAWGGFALLGRIANRTSRR